MKYRTKQLTRIQKCIRKSKSMAQSICAETGLRMKKRPPRWRQLERQLKKDRAKRWKSMVI